MNNEIIAGVDEVGRGPLAGPVIAAAVILDKNHNISGLKDSKKLSNKMREILYDKIIDNAVSIGIGEVDEKIIDIINIKNATFKAMQIALENLSIKPHKALIDGYALDYQSIPNEGIIGGDNLVDSIKAASIIAKVTRDRLMINYSNIFPEYGFENHKGYGTKLHLSALNNFRATPIHRRSFKPVKNNMPTIGWIEKHNKISWLGKKLAALHLLSKGLKILGIDREFNSIGKIDILGQFNNEIVLIEVETNNIKKEKKISHSNLHKISKNIENIISRYNLKSKQSSFFRVDKIIVNINNTGNEILHYERIKL
ncbi:MAG: ribonuclease HII [Candidatus Marinimicrobia bacterium]|nr:ribonuclease HII [Candidatus Neomarinimicrobiota bacterium]|tara:strand:- start:8983 stop:9918 length:936 start_codon:yes stop_codon:yes gene_type:complete